MNAITEEQFAILFDPFLTWDEIESILKTSFASESFQNTADLPVMTKPSPKAIRSRDACRGYCGGFRGDRPNPSCTSSSRRM